MTGGPIVWTDAEVLQVLDRAGRGQSAGQIALTMGVTRNAVCGLLHRVHREEADPCHFSDGALLQLMAAVEAGQDAAAIGRRMGLRRNAVLGLYHRLNAEAARDFGPTGNGTLPALWWRDGLALQESAA